MTMSPDLLSAGERGVGKRTVLIWEKSAHCMPFVGGNVSSLPRWWCSLARGPCLCRSPGRVVSAWIANDIVLKGLVVPDWFVRELDSLNGLFWQDNGFSWQCLSWRGSRDGNEQHYAQRQRRRRRRKGGGEGGEGRRRKRRRKRETLKRFYLTWNLNLTWEGNKLPGLA